MFFFGKLCWMLLALNLLLDDSGPLFAIAKSCCDCDSNYAIIMLHMTINGSFCQHYISRVLEVCLLWLSFILSLPLLWSSLNHWVFNNSLELFMLLFSQSFILLFIHFFFIQFRNKLLVGNDYKIHSFLPFIHFSYSFSNFICLLVHLFNNLFHYLFSYLFIHLLPIHLLVLIFIHPFVHSFIYSFLLWLSCRFLH